MSQPSLLYNYHLSHPMQTSHFVYESLHNDDSDYRKKNFMLLNFVNFKYHKTLVQEVELLVGVQQIIVLSTTIIRSQYIQKVSASKSFSR